jgi:shikimate dehydrogenase
VSAVTDKFAQFYKLGLLGARLDYSLSPQIHQAFFTASGLKGSYELVPQGQLPLNFVAQLQESGYAGFNITIPYKAAILAQLDRLSPEAGLCRAVNTVVLKDGLATGYNTDIYGFVEAGRGLLGEAKFDHALLIGAGGAGRAALLGLAQLGIKTVTVCLRGPSSEEFQAKAASLSQFVLGSGLKLEVEPLSLPEDLSKLESIVSRQALLLVNASPLGQSGNSLPLWLEVCLKALHKESLLFDLVYTREHKRTPLLEMAWDNGFTRQIDGKKMLVLQAAQAFYLWTGRAGSLEEGLRVFS